MSERATDRLSEPAADEATRGDLLHVRQAPLGHDAGGTVVHVAGEVDLTTVPQLDDELTSAERRLTAPGPLVLDLTAVTFLASAGLSMVVKHHEQCRATGLELRVVSGNRTVARTFLITGLNDMLAVFDTLETAVQTTHR
jgi:anti-sigma B factor antagonist